MQAPPVAEADRFDRQRREYVDEQYEVRSPRGNLAVGSAR
jgi:hypothetical protein